MVKAYLEQLRGKRRRVILMKPGARACGKIADDYVKVYSAFGEAEHRSSCTGLGMADPALQLGAPTSHRQ
jgi:hypothetical protein